MIEITIRKYLEKSLELPVLLEKKSGLTGNFVLIEKVGSNSKNKLGGSRFAVQSYAESMNNAAVLNHEVIKAMEEIVRLDEIVSCKLNSDYNFTDTTTKQYRYQAVFDIKHY